MFSPDDLEIMKQGPNLRRKFLDIMISSLKPNYLFLITEYFKTLEQRNAAVKKSYRNLDLLDIWDEKLVSLGYKIFSYRKEFINKIIAKIRDIHNNLTDNSEKIEIIYNSDCDNKENYAQNLKRSRFIDIQRGYTTKGIHRDDFIVHIDNKQVNIYGSQGQNRTVILSLKLAELSVVCEEVGEAPILLLDDVLSELDEKRRKNLLESVKDYQVLITSTDKEYLENGNVKYFKIVNGKII